MPIGNVSLCCFAFNKTADWLPRTSRKRRLRGKFWKCVARTTQASGRFAQAKGTSRFDNPCSFRTLRSTRPSCCCAATRTSGRIGRVGLVPYVERLHKELRNIDYSGFALAKTRYAPAVAEMTRISGAASRSRPARKLRQRGCAAGAARITKWRLVFPLPRRATLSWKACRPWSSAARPETRFRSAVRASKSCRRENPSTRRPSALGRSST